MIIIIIRKRGWEEEVVGNMQKNISPGLTLCLNYSNKFKVRCDWIRCCANLMSSQQHSRLKLQGTKTTWWVWVIESHKLWLFPFFNVLIKMKERLLKVLILCSTDLITHQHVLFCIFFANKTFFTQTATPVWTRYLLTGVTAGKKMSHTS